MNINARWSSREVSDFNHKQNMPINVSTKLRVLNFKTTLFHKPDRQTDRLKEANVSCLKLVCESAPKKVQFRKEISG